MPAALSVNGPAIGRYVQSRLTESNRRPIHYE
jgi:hypothetical protein